LPRPLEAAAIALLLAGVVWSVRRHSDAEQEPPVIDVHEAHVETPAR
jgi:hypothetical protein